jgi:hypothetical protein
MEESDRLDEQFSRGGFVSRKWMYGRGSIIGVLNVELLEKEPEPGQDILVVLVDEFGFISRATFDSGGSKGNDLSPQKPRQEPGKVRNPFSSSPTGPSPRTQKPREKSVDRTAEEAIPSAAARRLFGSQQESTGLCSREYQGRNTSTNRGFSRIYISYIG